MDVTWIEDTPGLDAWLSGLDGAALALDTEADSFHHYREKICLVQLSARERHALVDPFAELTWTSLARVLGDPAVPKVLHGADYDVRLLERDLGLVVRNLYDTSIAARLTGEEGSGLAALLGKHLGVTLDKSHQRADWSRRPLPPPMREYAVADTRHLEALAALLAARAEALGRTAWIREECDRIESVRWRERPRDDPDAFRRVKGSGALDRAALAVLRELFTWRDTMGQRRDRPVFRILRDETLVALAREAPSTIGEVAKVPGFPAPLARSPAAADLVDAIRRGAAVPESERPELRPPIRPRLAPEVELRLEAIRTRRDRLARDLGLEPSLIASRALLEEMARRDVAGTDPFAVPDLRAWQVELLRAPAA